MKGKIIIIVVCSGVFLSAGAVWGVHPSLSAFDSSLDTGSHHSYATDQWYKIYSGNSSLWVSNYGTYGGETYFNDEGFRYNTSVYSDPESYAGVRCLTDSPSQRNYDSDMFTVAYMPVPKTLPGASSITLRYYAKWNIEQERDYCELVYVTTSSGVPGENDWNHLDATSTIPNHPTLPVQAEAGGDIYANDPGTDDPQETWTLEQADLTSLAGQTIRLGFIFHTDHSNIKSYDGIYIDELEIVADSNTIYEAHFDSTLENWSYHPYEGDGEGWGLSEDLPEEVMLIKNGHFCVGNSTAYVANRGDWGALINGIKGPDTLYTRFSNSGTIHVGDPEFEVILYSYIWDDFAINDYYVSNISGDSFNNVYIGMGNNVAIEFGSDTQGNEQFYYEAARDVGKWNNNGNTTDDPMTGVIYLSAGTTASYNVGSNLDPADDATVFNNMSNGQHDDPAPSGPWSANGRWINIFGVGPFNMGPGVQRRFAVGFVGGVGLNNLNTNIDQCISYYGLLDDHTGIRSASLGEIKAMYR
ncbi:MAG: hypothetical protein GY771_14860 [bacterium]|nr:hypothetical protein [bacterium]